MPFDGDTLQTQIDAQIHDFGDVEKMRLSVCSYDEAQAKLFVAALRQLRPHVHSPQALGRHIRALSARPALREGERIQLSIGRSLYERARLARLAT